MLHATPRATIPPESSNLPLASAFAKPAQSERSASRLTASRIAPVLLTIFAGLALFGCGGSKNKSAAAAAAQTPPEVVTAPVVQKTVPIYGEFVGQTQAVNTVEIRSQINGFLQAIDFREGAIVNKGQLLFVIDPRPYQAALAQAQATLANDQAALEKAKRDVAMYTPAEQQHAVSKQQLNTAIATQQEAAATVNVAQAQVDQAKLNLSYTQIRSPIRGGIGVAQVRIGGLVQAGSTLLDTVYSIDPMYVNFSVSEDQYLDYQKRTQGGRNAPPPPPIELILADGSTYQHTGQINMVAPQVNPSTGTLSVRAEFPNPDGLLKAGLFVRVRFVTREQQNALLIPATAVQQLQGTNSVFVVGPDDKVQSRSITLGPAVDHSQVVNSGLQPGETVIVQGTQKVQPGMLVKPVPESSTPQEGQQSTNPSTAPSGAGRQ